MSPGLAKLYTTFGANVVLLPIPKGRKGPININWQQITFNDAQTLEYQQALEDCIARGGNIGVRLGELSGGLVSIDIDVDELVERYLALNPKLRRSTRTKARRGCNIFLRIKPGTPYPNSQAVYNLYDDNGKKYGEWRCGGGELGAQTVVFGVHPEGQPYRTENDCPPVEITSFDELQWLFPFDNAPGQKSAPDSANGNAQAQPGAGATAKPNGQSSVFDPQAAYSQALTQLGAPFIKSQRGYNINQPFFARLFGVRRLAIYDLKSPGAYQYNETNGQWDRLCPEKLYALIQSDIFAEAALRGFPDVGAKVNIALLKSVAELIKSDPVIAKENFFSRSAREQPVIHTANGMWRLEKNGSITRHEFSPEFRSRHMIPIPYNPQADCPRFQNELLKPVLSKKDVDTLQRYNGLILIGGNRAQKILMLLGEGGTGKGTIVRLIGLVIGRNNVAQLRIKELNGRFETSRLIGKMLLTIVEATYDCLSQDGAEIIKALVGHDLMDGEQKYRNEPLPFDGEFPIIYVSNEDPSIRLSGDESAWARRLVPLQFPNKRPDGSVVIDNFEEELFGQEAEGIFAWMVEGARSHYAELEAKKGFAVTPEQIRRTQEIIARSKSILTFVLDGLIASGTCDLSTDELYDGYVAYCQDKNWHPFPERTFAEIVRPLILQHFGIGKSHDIARIKPNGKTSYVRGYRSIRLKL